MMVGTAPADATDLPELLGSDRFVLFGGAATNLVLALDAPIHDFDIALRPDFPVATLLDRLQARGYAVQRTPRPFLVDGVHPVQMYAATNGSTLLDLNVVDDFGILGQFDLDSVVIDQRSGQVHGASRARAAFERGTIQAVRGLAREDARLLLTRLIVLAGKYGLDLCHPAHVAVLRQLEPRLGGPVPDTGFHRTDVPGILVSSVLGTLLRSPGRAGLVAALLDSGALGRALPALHDVLRRLRGHGCTGLAGVAEKAALVALLRAQAGDDDERQRLDACLAPMWTWDRGDPLQG
jgi:hypothetical protein